MRYLQIQFNKEQGKALENLAEKLDTTEIKTVALALALLEIAIKERKEGNDIGVIKEDVVIKEIVGIF